LFVRNFEEEISVTEFAILSAPTVPARRRSNILLGIITAHHPSRWWYRVGARQTFLSSSALDHVYVFGRAPLPNWVAQPEPDELWVDCDDRKEWMYHKVQALCKYALDAGYSYLFRVCDDTQLFPDRIAKAGLESFDYAGQMPCKFSLGGTFKTWFRGGFDFMHGGTGIWLSRKAMQMIVDDRMDSCVCDMPAQVDVGFGLTTAGHKVWWDDLRVGEVLKGMLPWDSPVRNEPVLAYQRNGIQVFEDSDLFYESDPSRPLAIHDPGVSKNNGGRLDGLKRQIRHRNIAQAMAAARVPAAEIAEVANAD
jgi:hypothetical protein